MGFYYDQNENFYLELECGPAQPYLFIVVVVIELPNDIPISYAHELLVVVVINCFILTAGY